MKFLKKFSLFETIVAVALIALLASLLLPRLARAQPYTTNSTSNYFGAQAYNSAMPNPLNPAATLAAQYAVGIQAGSITAGLVPMNGTYTNSFTTNIYSTAPAVVLTVSGTNTIAAVTQTTTTNFIVTMMNTNDTIWWVAAGH